MGSGVSVSMTYLTDLELSLVADGCDTRRYLWGDWPVLVGWRRDTISATSRHLVAFTVAVAMDDVDLGGVRSFEEKSIRLARANMARIPPWPKTYGIVFPTMIGRRVTPDAAAWYARKQHRLREILSRPVVVDETRETVCTYRGRSFVGRDIAEYADDKRDRYFPEVNAALLR
jgi:hypothetical protein